MIPFNRPSVEGGELAYAEEALTSGHTAAKGANGRRVREILADAIDTRDVFLTTSCTAALEMSALLMGLGPGDEVIVPSFTFVTSALAFARTGARLVFADIEGETLGIDPAHVAELLSPATRAVVAVHYAGVPADLDGLADVLADRPDVSLVEDNAHGLFGSHRGRPLGSFGRFSTLSFHETKNYSCGEGGALFVNHDDDVDRAHVVFDKGTNRRAFLLGQVDKYSWVDTGSSFGLSELLAGVLRGQLEAAEDIRGRRRRIFARYDAAIRPEAARLDLRPPVVPDTAGCAYHMYYVLLPDREVRNEVLGRCNDAGVQATFHYVPLHSAPGARPHTDRVADCPVTDDVSGRLLRLPFFNDLAVDDVDRCAEVFLEAVEAATG